MRDACPMQHRASYFQLCPCRRRWRPVGRRRWIGSSTPWSWYDQCNELKWYRLWRETAERNSVEVALCSPCAVPEKSLTQWPGVATRWELRSSKASFYWQTLIRSASFPSALLAIQRYYAKVYGSSRVLLPYKLVWDIVTWRSVYFCITPP